MRHKLDNHKKKIMFNEKDKEEFTRSCNCQDKTSCPLKAKCLQEGIVYKAIVSQTKWKNKTPLPRGKISYIIRQILIIKQTIGDFRNMPALKKHLLQSLNWCSEETKQPDEKVTNFEETEYADVLLWNG